MDRKLQSTHVIDVFADQFILRVVPAHMPSGNVLAFVAQAVRDWIKAVGAGIACIAPGSPWENGLRESLISKLRGDLLNGEILHSLREAESGIESWRQLCNAQRPHSPLGNRPRAPEVIQWRPNLSCTKTEPGPPDGDRPPAHPVS
jgi:putative transposase